MKKKHVTLHISATVEYDEAVVDPVRLGEIMTVSAARAENAAVAHITSLHLRGLGLSDMDGWADLSDDALNVRVDDMDYEVMDG